MGAGDGSVVAVTGANGFLGTHIVELLLKRGYSVRATVRNVKDPKKVAHLKALPGADERLTLWNADLMKKGSFLPVFKGVDYVMHVAAPVIMRHPDPERAVIRPVVDGMRNVLDAVEQNVDSIKKVVLTSSCEAAYNHVEARQGKVFTEEDWNDVVTRDDPYSWSKVLAERLAVEEFEKREKLRGVPLVRVCPAWIIGPLHHGHAPPLSMEPLIAFGHGQYPLIPNLHQQVVDVRDVAEAHLLAIEKEEAHGRYLVVNHPVSFAEICTFMRGTSLAHLLHLPSITMPDVFALMAPLFDNRVTLRWMRDNLNTRYVCSNERSRSHLGLKYRDSKDTFEDTLLSLQAHGVLAPPRYSPLLVMTTVSVMVVAVILGVLRMLGVV